MLTRRKHSKIFLVAVCLFMATAAIFLLANFAMAANFWGDNTNGESFRQNAGLVGGTTDLRVIVANVIRTIIGFLGIIAVGLIIYAGFLWMTSGGDEQKIEQAKKILQNALVGLIIIVLAFAIVSFILNFFKGLGGGGSNNQPAPPPGNYGLSAIGNGIIQSHYPARNQREVPRNTSIIITFREQILASSLCTNPVNPSTQEVPDKQKICKGIDTAQGNITGNANDTVIRIFRQSEADKCALSYSSAPDDCASLVNAKVYSDVNNKIFVFVPINYLGSSTEYMNYSVYLGSDLKRQLNSADAFPWAGGYYTWNFEVSNKIDLTPPKVMDNGVFPSPDGVEGNNDNKDDTKTTVGAVQASGSITVNSRPSIDRDARVVSTIKAGADINDPLDVAVVSKDCKQEGNFQIAVAVGPVVSLYKHDVARDRADQYSIAMGQGIVGTNGGGLKQAVFSECNLTLTLTAGAFTAGNTWNLVLSKATVADTIVVGDVAYIASAIEDIPNHKFGVGSSDTPAQIVQSIYNVLFNNSLVNRTIGDHLIELTAILAGAAGNSISLSSSNNDVLKITPMKDGADKEIKIKVNGMTDQPMNSAIQINFNEAIMPLTVSGKSDEVRNFIRVVNADTTAKAEGEACETEADCKSFKCDGDTKKCVENIVNTAGARAAGADCNADADCKSSICAGNPRKCVAANYLEGKFAISNQYSTVEFLSDKECGYNTCGEKIYCLPANSHLKVELNAASLTACASDSDCQTYSPFNKCDLARNLCWDGAKYYPQADKNKPAIVDGITDAAFNSLDGNRDVLANGPVSYYNENLPEENEAQRLLKAAGGDSFKWSFFISDILDLIPPKIKAPTIPATGASGVDLIEAVELSFNKLMLSSRLSTGSITIQNGKDLITHYLLNLRSSIDQPLGYWVTNTKRQVEDNRIFIDSTDVSINHTTFGSATTYTAQASSGLKDIYQNCFLPCAADSGVCSETGGVNDLKPCCCSGTPAASCP